MNAKELKIEAPEGYEVDWDNSSNNVIRFKPIKKTITYEDIVKKLYPGKCYYINNNQTSEKQICQLLYLNKLMNVAKYLNGDWEPNWNDEFEDKFCFYYSEKLNICSKRYSNFGCAYFKTIDLAHQAIEILGEEEVKKALGIFE